MLKYQHLYQLYHQLNKGQQTVFNMMYGSIDTIREDKIDWAIKQCERSIAKNVEKRDQKINQIITPIISQLPNIKVSSKPQEQQYTIDGKIPSPGDTFYYQSQYSDTPLEGKVKEVHNGAVVSSNGVQYDFSKITIKTVSDFREEKLNNLFNDN